VPAPIGPVTFPVDPATSGRPYGTAPGMLTFRGNQTRSYYGEGPVPTAPRVVWQYPQDDAMCSNSSAGGETKQWCGIGWTGQVNTLDQDDGSTWVLFGAMDSRFHVLDAASGAPVKPPLRVGDINKGSATVDPDGFPLWYGGSRDNLLRVMALDRDEIEVLWSFRHDTVRPTKWNSDWDGAPLVVDDLLIAPGENSRLQIFRLNRGYGDDGKVTVDPQLVFSAPAWDDQLLRDVGDEVSVENSVVVVGDIAWFSNSGGLLQGWDLAPLREGGEPRRVFRFWTGDDTDASIVADGDGMLYVASEFERFNQRSKDIGQLLKIDPSIDPAEGNPVVWSLADQDYRGFGNAAGFWATPALHRGVVIVPNNGGLLRGVDAATGAVLWSKQLEPHTWSSPVVVDDVLIQGDCDGVLRGYDASDPRVDPPELWSVELTGCIEATPTVWKGRIYVGTRAGRLYAIGDA
jgi:outer membrane protein assembly factor BamB